MAGDRGQATPIYMAAVVGLLFLVLVYLAFGQADVTRNGAQTAADAAALAAAKQSRDDLELVDVIDDLEAVFGGQVPADTPDGCMRAVDFAARNDAVAGYQDCVPLNDGRWGFTVDVKSRESMGNSVIDGTGSKHAMATATAVIEPRCTFMPEESEAPEPDEENEEAEDDKEKPSPGKLRCDAQDWDIDPENLDLLPDMADLFTVRLAED
ncbi:pilus assembly protein TadG-related protein [Streptomyces peucetius]|uniref:Pilus assembly protein TadG-related protein n=1 Tax=Streptomyces peucetius TaxID=1950 RepID=A0ABY6II02_STRPE|nr:pilus assembly protein TadG-related protein [Streptomyces peucetius]UYQ66635.1 pilus assembly protein TadG-related protein [Streptomyces peucetius]